MYMYIFQFVHNLQIENPDSDILPSPELMQEDLGINIGKDYEVIPSAGLEEKQCEDVVTDQSDTTEDSEGKTTECFGKWVGKGRG